MSEAHRPSNRPFAIYHQRIAETPNHFRPVAVVVVTPSLRTSGLLSLLSDRQARILLTLLTFLSANGEVRATAQQVAQALGVPVPLASLWLSGLAWRRFQGVHLIYRIERAEGYPVYALSWQFIDRYRSQHPDEYVNGRPAPIATREEVLAHSRSTYARPRAEVEREVLEQLGYSPEEMAPTPEGLLRRRLRGLKLEREDIQFLIETYGTERIQRQLDWLPERRAKNQARYLLAAVKGDYPGPLGQRTEGAPEKGEHV